MGKESNCYGESSRTVFERYREHIQGEENEKDNNALFKLDAIEHYGEPQEYKVNVISKHRKPMDRQMKEKMLMENKIRSQKLMN